MNLIIYYCYFIMKYIREVQLFALLLQAAHLLYNCPQLLPPHVYAPSRSPSRKAQSSTP